MQILRKYQLDVIFLFFAFLIFIWLGFLALEQFGADPHQYEWLIAGPFILLYAVYLWKIRGEISLAERRALTGKTLAYWLGLGVLIFSSYAEPVPARDYWAINGLFVVFTLFLADSYWDFRAMTLKNIIKK